MGFFLFSEDRLSTHIYIYAGRSMCACVCVCLCRKDKFYFNYGKCIRLIYCCLCVVTCSWDDRGGVGLYSTCTPRVRVYYLQYIIASTSTICVRLSSSRS